VIRKGEHAIAKRELLNTLGARIVWLGFKPRVSGQSFDSSSSEGKSVLHVSFIPHSTDLELTLDVAIRANAIEDLVNEFDAKLNPAEKRQSMTLGAEIGNLSQGRPLRWTITDLSDIPAVSKQMTGWFERVGLPFFRAYSDRPAIHGVLVGSSSSDTLLCPILGPRSMRAIASAYLLGKTSDLEALMSRIEARLVEKQDLYLDDFRVLCRDLLARKNS
jgi:hypothetical protein